VLAVLLAMVFVWYVWVAPRFGD